MATLETLLKFYPDDLSLLAPAGWLAEVRIRFTSPFSTKNEMPKAWVDHYTRNGYLGDDPLLAWARARHGVRRWTELPVQDPRGILVAAAKFGLRHGAVAAVVDADTGIRSIAIGAREDREFSPSELRLFEEVLRSIHEYAARDFSLTVKESAVLACLRQGKRFKDIADELGVSEGAIKQRLKNARVKLGAKTTTEAAHLASEFGLI